MSKPTIIFVASEAMPLAKTGGLADVTGSLPHALLELGHQIAVIIPYYRRLIDHAGYSIESCQLSLSIKIDNHLRTVPLHQINLHGVQYILVEQDDLYDRDGLYGPPGTDWPDNLLRYLLFCRAVLQGTAELFDHVDIFHCHDWQTGMLPLLLRKQYQHLPQISRAHCVYTIHNLAYQGLFGAQWIPRLGLPPEAFQPEGYEFFGQINCMKAGIAATDVITTVSATYAEEIVRPQYGCGLEGFLSQRQDRISGIVNGLDLETWNPATDKFLIKNFNAEQPQGKTLCKAALQRECGFKLTRTSPLLAVVSRLAEQKGISMLIDSLPKWLKTGCQIVILGSGNPDYEDQLRTIAELHPQQLHFTSGFNDPLAHRIYAGSDLFIMPSIFEPCGLGQLIAMRYGSIPVVRRTGGLADTVIDPAESAPTATGFLFDQADAEALQQCLERALTCYHLDDTWKSMVFNAMHRDSSWNVSAAQYEKIYLGLITGTPH